MASNVDPVLLVGDPRLRQASAAVRDFADAGFAGATRRLAATLAEFRRANGFGRAISAPQIGVPLRLIATEVPDLPRLLVNPEIAWRSDETFTMWDDCMSFPELLVKVRRHASISIRYVDERGDAHERRGLGRAMAELLQHEIDHLDGVLALDRAEGRDAIVHRAVFTERRDYFRAQVDYVIG